MSSNLKSSQVGNQSHASELWLEDRELGRAATDARFSNSAVKQTQ
jgi:hypothetical protein